MIWFNYSFHLGQDKFLVVGGRSKLKIFYCLFIVFKNYFFLKNKKNKKNMFDSNIFLF